MRDLLPIVVVEAAEVDIPIQREDLLGGDGGSSGGGGNGGSVGILRVGVVESGKIDVAICRDEARVGRRGGGRREVASRRR